MALSPKDTEIVDVADPTRCREWEAFIDFWLEKQPKGQEDYSFSFSFSEDYQIGSGPVTRVPSELSRLDLDELDKRYAAAGWDVTNLFDVGRSGTGSQMSLKRPGPRRSLSTEEILTRARERGSGRTTNEPT